jgi:IS30 family transposase
VIQPIVATMVRERLVIDLVDMRLFKEHNDDFGWILTAVDHFTGFAMAHPIYHKEAEEVAERLWEAFKYYGVWQSVHADRGGEFNNELLHHLEALLNVRTIHGASYSPWEQGKVETFNQTLERTLGIVT